MSGCWRWMVSMIGSALMLAPALGQTASQVLEVAQLLAAGEEIASARNGERQRLAGIVSALERLGAHPTASGQQDPILQWRDMVGAEAPPLRGRILGPAFRRGELQPGAHVATEQLFMAGQRANVALSAAGEGTLRISIVDSTDKSVCQPEKGARTWSCTWLPMFSGRHRISVTNVGDRPVDYYLVTN